MRLYIDTSSNLSTTVSLGRKTLEIDTKESHSQVVIQSINKLLGHTPKNLSKLSEVRVNVGPGSFTGLRVGVAIANTLGFVLGIKVNGKKLLNSPPIEPKYQ
ncbi:MAG: Peptidase M22, glycoprotease YdiC [Microgenomates group bacterium GW2011_GWA2_44_7]|nr:MAG: Peptidase M22, glycoprotease YdiC [Microgenomates group bacterium GW2011_GWA2_44_7]KKT78433.1 MAG: Peptidase M22, glycoprotease YdiC [Microgenomates group bacterium GW2011_GWB1_44_8]